MTGNVPPVRAFVMLAVAAAIWIYAVLVQNVEAEKICLVALGGAAMLSLVLTPFGHEQTALQRWLLAATILLPGYAWLQTIELPIGVVRAVSPARAAIQDTLAPLAPGAGAAAAISVNPGLTEANVIRLLAYMALFWIIYRLASAPSYSPWVVAVPVMCAGALQALLGILQYAGDPAVGVASGTYENRNHFAGLMEMTFPFFLIGAISIGTRVQLRRGSKSSVLLAAGSCVFGCVIILIATILSLSRTGVVLVLLSVVLAVAILVSRYRPSRLQWLWLSCGAILAILVLVALAPERLVERFVQLPGSGEDRRLLWLQTVRVIADFPWTGCGLGAYRDIWMSYKTSMPLWETDFVHNDYLQLLAEVGVVGGAIALGMLTLIGLCAARVRQHRDLGIACTVALGAILLHSVDDFNLYIPANAMLVAWVAGILAGLERRQRYFSPEPSGSLPDRIAL